MHIEGGSRTAEPDQATAPARPPVERRRRCDVCGAEGASAQAFGPGGRAGLDAVLCDRHAEQLAAKLAEKMAEQLALMRARHAGVTRLEGRRLRDGEALDVIRAWARARGYPVSAQGSVSPRILEAYRAASTGGGSAS